VPLPDPPAPLEPGATVGFIGLGRMGVPMAGRLVTAGYRVQGFDSVESARSRFADETGVAAVGAGADAALGAAVVILMLPSSAVVRQVLIADGVLQAAAAAGALVVDMSSSEPTVTRELAEEAARRGVTLIDAPVSGGVRGALDGTLTVMTGGRLADVDACRPLFGVLGRSVQHAGATGAGHALKALNNLLSATTLLASSEALLAGRRFGIDPEIMLTAINGSTGRSYSTEYKLPTFVLPRTFSSGFTLQLMVKDMRIAAGLADATESPLPLGRSALALWEQALDALPGDADHTEIARWIEMLVPSGAGVDTASDGESP
jgi:3-hydroxyisobutyrate dehydrogenase